MKAMPITSNYAMGNAAGGGMVIMSNNPLFGMRRRDLYRLADAWGVEYPKDAPATEMRQLLMSRGIDGSQEPPKPIEAKPRADVTEEMREAPSVSLNYEDMKFFDLRKLCKERGIEYSQKTNKAALIEKLKDADFYGEVAS